MAEVNLESVFADSILQSMGDGVFVLAADGRIVAVNKAASSIMGIENAESMTLAQIAMDETDNDTFMQVLLDSLFDGVTVHDRIIPFVRPDGETVTMSVTASHLRDESGELLGAFIVIRDMSEVEELRDSRDTLTVELQDALRVADEKTKELEASLEFGHKIRTWTSAAVIVLFIGLGIYFWSSDSSIDTDTHTAVVSSGADAPSMTVQPRPLTRSISLSGIVAPLEEVALSAPFQGVVREKHFFYGDRVKRGQTLVVLDTSEIESKLRDARAEYIKAKKNYLELEQWEKNPDVSKARRDLSQARNQLSQAENKAKEDKTLLDAGVIPRSEYDSTVQELRDKKMQFLSSRENLKSVLDKGDDEYQEIARMELENAQAKMEAAEAKLARATITAPVSGVAIKPVAGEKETRRDVTTGMVVSDGQSLLSVASIEGLSITTEVDELDINNLEDGQSVFVSGDAFPDIRLKGRIAQISSQANDGQVPTFTATIRLRDLPDNVERKVRLGMTANMQVETYSNPKALMVPLSAVTRKNGKSVVYVKGEDGTSQEREVKTGYTTLSEVEILSGITAGTVILTNATS